MFHQPITQLLQNMSAIELQFWLDKRLDAELLGDEREDYRAARVEAAVANYAGKHLADGVSVSPTDCMPFSYRNEPSQDELAEKLKFQFGQLAAMHEIRTNKQKAEAKTVLTNEANNGIGG